MDIASRTRWYLKNLLHCKDNGWILITHEYMRIHWEQLQNEVTPSLFSSWEMRPFTADEVREVEQYFIPDELFEQLEKQYGSRTEMLWQLSTDGNEQLENCLQDIVDAIRSKHPYEKIDGMFHSLEAWQPLRNVCKQNNISLIPYSFSALRRPHGYRQTLYFVSQKGRLCTTEECQNRFTNYLDENNNFSPIFSNRELIAILGKERTLPLLPLLQAEPKYEMGICTECFSFLPQFSVFDKNTDDDTRYECEKLYDKSQITVRNHSLQVDYMHLDRTTVHNDPAAWILSSRRLTLSRSQIGLKILLWNRTAVVPSDSLSFSFIEDPFPN